MDSTTNDIQLQPLEWMFIIKRSIYETRHDLHRARPVSASHLSALRHTVHGSAPTVYITTIRILTSMLPTWLTVQKTIK